MIQELRDILFVDIETVANTYDYNAMDERMKIQWSRKASFLRREKDQTDEGIEIRSGVQVHAAPLKFAMDGCVKFAYPHGHDELLLIALENKTRKETLLRTVPDVSMDGTFLAFPPHQVYKNGQGFPVTKTDDYEMVMVHHHPLQKKEDQHGMGNYLLYMTPGACPGPSTAQVR